MFTSSHVIIGLYTKRFFPTTMYIYVGTTDGRKQYKEWPDLLTQCLQVC